MEKQKKLFQKHAEQKLLLPKCPTKKYSGILTQANGMEHQAATEFKALLPASSKKLKALKAALQACQSESFMICSKNKVIQF